MIEEPVSRALIVAMRRIMVIFFWFLLKEWNVELFGDEVQDQD